MRNRKIVLAAFISVLLLNLCVCGGDAVCADSKIAYITVDDGPSPENTSAILDLLRDEGIKATFFVLAHEGMDDIYERIINEGHEVGNHTYSHDYKNLYCSDSTEYFINDVMKMQNFLDSRFGYKARVFRFPGGSCSWNKEVISKRKTILEEMGLRYFDWDVSTCDTDPYSRNSEVLVSNVVTNTLGREKLIILMHDSPGKQPTVRALPSIIARLREQGYVFDTLGNY